MLYQTLRKTNAVQGFRTGERKRTKVEVMREQKRKKMMAHAKDKCFRKETVFLYVIIKMREMYSGMVVD